jgi:hypothetical protein
LAGCPLSPAKRVGTGQKRYRESPKMLGCGPRWGLCEQTHSLPGEMSDVMSTRLL